MNISSGSQEVVIGIIDGPIDFDHPDFRYSHIRTVNDRQLGMCKSASSIACIHGTFVVGMLSAKRGTNTLGMCPNCSVILRPIFIEDVDNNKLHLPSSTPRELSKAIVETINAGAKIINLSVGLSTSSLTPYPEIQEAYNYASQRGVIIVVAAGNQGNVGYISILNHPWIIPVAACDDYGRLIPISNFGPSIGNRGLMAPGVNITSTIPEGKYTKMSGTSISVPFVTGTIALLWSIFPKARAGEIMRSVIIGASSHRHNTIVPPLLNAESALILLKSSIR